MDSVIIAKMDGTENEHPEIEVKGFPTILFYPAGSDRTPIVFEGGDRSLKSLTKFIKVGVCGGAPTSLRFGLKTHAGIGLNRVSRYRMVLVTLTVELEATWTTLCRRTRHAAGVAPNRLPQTNVAV